MVGISIFVLGGFGAEAIKQGLHEAFSADTTSSVIDQPSRLLFLSEHIRITVEELAELLSEPLILFGIAQFALESLSSSSGSALSV